MPQGPVLQGSSDPFPQPARPLRWPLSRVLGEGSHMAPHVLKRGTATAPCDTGRPCGPGIRGSGSKFQRHRFVLVPPQAGDLCLGLSIFVCTRVSALPTSGKVCLAHELTRHIHHNPKGQSAKHLSGTVKNSLPTSRTCFSLFLIRVFTYSVIASGLRKGYKIN